MNVKEYFLKRALCVRFGRYCSLYDDNTIGIIRIAKLDDESVHIADILQHKTLKETSRKRTNL